ncbi:MAG: hypothetical protein AUK64_2402, partial [bacterium P201]
YGKEETQFCFYYRNIIIILQKSYSEKISVTFNNVSST